MSLFWSYRLGQQSLTGEWARIHHIDKGGGDTPDRKSIASTWNIYLIWRKKWFYRWQSFYRIYRELSLSGKDFCTDTKGKESQSYLSQRSSHNMVKKEHISFLKENENIIMTIHRHWIILVFHFLYFLALFVSSWILFSYQGVMIEIVGSALYWWGLSLYWIVFLTFILLDWINDELDIIIITDSRVISVEQISALSRTVTECALDRVQEVTAHTAGIFQTVFGFGDVHIHTASESSHMIVSYSPDPIENCRRINNIIQGYRTTNTPGKIIEKGGL